MAAQGATLTRRAGAALDDAAAEAFAQAMASGVTLPVAAHGAGVGKPKALAWMKTEAMRTRLEELRSHRQTITTVSVAWIAEQYKQIVSQARAGSEYTALSKDGEAVELTDKPDLKAAVMALKELHQLVTKDPHLFAGGVPIPANAKTPADVRKHVRGILSAPITVAGESVPHEAAE